MNYLHLFLIEMKALLGSRSHSFGLISLLTLSVYGQTGPSIDWRVSLGGPLTDMAYSISATTDGGSIVAGEKNGSTTPDAWIVKLDSEGGVEWQRTFGGSGHDGAYVIIELVEGGYLFAGYTDSENGDVQGHHGQGDYWVVRLNANGDLLWQKCLGGVNNDVAWGVHQASDGGFLVTGESQSSDGHLTVNNGGPDMWLLKLDQHGELLWQRPYGGSGIDAGLALIETQDGGIVSVGYTFSDDGDVGSGNQGGSDYWIVKVSASGELLWERTMGGNSIEIATSLYERESDGTLVVVGDASSANGDLTETFGDYDAWVVTLSANGIPGWSRSYGGSGADRPRAILAQGDDLILAGSTSSTNGDVLNHNGNNDAWLLKIDTNGEVLWSSAYGGSASDVCSGADIRTDGSLIFVGSTNSSGWTAPSGGGQDWFIVALEREDVRIEELSEAHIVSLFPNPAIDHLYIKHNGLLNETIEITSLSGQVHSYFSAGTDITLLNVANLPSGSYILHTSRSPRSDSNLLFIKE